MFRQGKLLMAVAILFAAGACSGHEPEKPGKAFEPIVLTKAEQEINSGVNNFGFDVFRQVSTDGQVMISPLSLSLALTLTSQGAAGITAQEMTAALGFEGYTPEEVAGYYQKIVEGLLKADPKTDLQIANAIWADLDIHLKSGFVARGQKYFASELTSSDFSQKATLDAINSWCAKHTNGKIPSILKEMPKGMKMALLNALYFKGEWANPFSADGKMDFRTVGGSKLSLNQMRRQGSFAYAASKDFQCVSLPYGNTAFVMDVILPAEGLSFAEAVKKLDAKTYEGLIAHAGTEDVIVRMPPFKFDFEVELTDLLRKSMPLAFSNYADFSEMAEESLKIGLVKQKTFIEVNEKGTEAAAVTVVGMMKTTAVAPPREPIEFTADRPFFFVIRERSTGAVLFIGQKVK